MMKTRSLMMKKCRNLKNEIKTRWGDSMNLLYRSHIINKSRRSYGMMLVEESLHKALIRVGRIVISYLFFAKKNGEFLARQQLAQEQRKWRCHLSSKPS